MKALKKNSQQSFYFLGGKYATFYPKLAGESIKDIVLNLYIDINVLVYEKWLMMKV